MAKAPLRSSNVSVIPIPSIVKVIPIIVHLGWTQLYEFGLIRPKKQPNATHIGNKVDIVSPTTSTQPLKLLPLLWTISSFALKLFDELLHRIGGRKRPVLLRLRDVRVVGGEITFALQGESSVAESRVQEVRVCLYLRFLGELGLKGSLFGQRTPSDLQKGIPWSDERKEACIVSSLPLMANLWLLSVQVGSENKSTFRGYIPKYRISLESWNTKKRIDDKGY